MALRVPLPSIRGFVGFSSPQLQTNGFPYSLICRVVLSPPSLRTQLGPFARSGFCLLLMLFFFSASSDWAIPPLSYFDPPLQLYVPKVCMLFYFCFFSLWTYVSPFSFPPLLLSLYSFFRQSTAGLTLFSLTLSALYTDAFVNLLFFLQRCLPCPNVPVELSGTGPPPSSLHDLTTPPCSLWPFPALEAELLSNMPENWHAWAGRLLPPTPRMLPAGVFKALSRPSFLLFLLPPVRGLLRVSTFLNPDERSPWIFFLFVARYGYSPFVFRTSDFDIFFFQRCLVQFT